MNSFIQNIRDILCRDLEALFKEMEGIPDDLLWKSLPGIINPVGTLSHHLCGNLQHFIGFLLGEIPYLRNLEDEFSQIRLSKKELLDEIEITRLSVYQSLSQLAPERLFEPMPQPPKQHEGKTVEFFLIQLCCHLSRHRGQLNYLQRILLKT